MNETLVKFMNNVGITTYVPLERDYLKLAYYNRMIPQPGTPEAELERLILKIYHFDYYYDYSTDNSVWRNGTDNERAVKDSIHAIDDKELREFLLSSFNANGREQLMGRYSWLFGYQVNSPFADLVQAGCTPSEAGNLISIVKFIKGQVSELQSRNISHCSVYAKNPAGVKKLIREARETGSLPMADPVTIPVHLYRNWGHIGALLDDRSVYAAMLPMLELGVMYWGNITRYSVGSVTLFM